LFLFFGGAAWQRINGQGRVMQTNHRALQHARAAEKTKTTFWELHYYKQVTPREFKARQSPVWFASAFSKIAPDTPIKTAERKQLVAQFCGRSASNSAAIVI
jgi:hypothetical protein